MTIKNFRQNTVFVKSQPLIQQLQENTDLINFKTDSHCTWELMSQETFAMHANKQNIHSTERLFHLMQIKLRLWENPWKIHQYEMNGGLYFTFSLLCAAMVILLFTYVMIKPVGPIRTLTMLNSRSDPQDPQPQIQILKAPVLILLSLRTTDQFAGLFFPSIAEQQTSHSFDNLSDASAEI